MPLAQRCEHVRKPLIFSSPLSKVNATIYKRDVDPASVVIRLVNLHMHSLSKSLFGILALLFGFAQLMVAPLELALNSLESAPLHVCSNLVDELQHFSCKLC